jgi:hypothetical protein
MKDIRIKLSAQQALVPTKAPYASGQGNGVPSSADGQKPFLYIWVKALLDTVIIVNETPARERIPEPM